MQVEPLLVSGQPVILGFDPGRQKCGIAVMGIDRAVGYQQVVDSRAAIVTVQDLRLKFPISLMVLGNQTSSQEWKQKLLEEISDPPRIVLVDERNSTLEARDRYWQLYPPRGVGQLVPQALRRIPRPIDDIVAILLIERYLEQLLD